jgi:hypothetical protein
LVTFHPFYFLFVDDGPFDGGYVSNELGEYTYEDSVDWDELVSYFGLHGNQRMTIKLLGQLGDIELHWKCHVR